LRRRSLADGEFSKWWGQVLQAIQPSLAAPGSTERLAVLRLRARLELPLFVNGDARITPDDDEEAAPLALLSMLEDLSPADSCHGHSGRC
jgi:hypothetical protein